MSDPTLSTRRMTIPLTESATAEVERVIDELGLPRHVIINTASTIASALITACLADAVGRAKPERVRQWFGRPESPPTRGGPHS